MQMNFDAGDDAPIVCEGCGTELPPFLDGCPYCDDASDFYETETAACPECGATIEVDVSSCPVCNRWVKGRVGRTPPKGPKILAWAIVIVFAVLILMAILR